MTDPSLKRDDSSYLQGLQPIQAAIPNSLVSREVSRSKGMFEESVRDAIETKTQTARVLDRRNNRMV